MATNHANPTVQTLAHESAPASPTLTNPDMILPYNDSPSRPYRQSPPYLSLEIHSPPHVLDDVVENRMYQHGGPLSDIGEEESIATMSRRSSSGSATPIDASSMASERPWHMERRKSDDSVSTVNSISDLARWKNFDSRIESSGAQPATTENSVLEVPKLEERRGSFTSVAGDEAESNALSERAERILANAKKRLTALEGNLSRARSSVLLSPTTRVNGGMGEHRQAGGLYRSISQNGERLYGQLGGSRRRSMLSPARSSSPGHSRIVSENSAPSKETHIRPGEFRSVSALEHNYTRAVDNLLDTSSKGSPSTSSHKSPLSGSSPFQSPLNVVKEEELTATPVSQPTRGLGIINSSSMENFGSRTSSTDLSDGATRPLSSASARELHEQVNDLKSRITNLRVQAKVDSLRRRSMQSLRQASPFTAAEGWEDKDADLSPSPNAAIRTIRRMPSSERLHPKQSPVPSETRVEAEGIQPAPPERTPQKPIVQQDFLTPNNMFEDRGVRTPDHERSVNGETSYEDAAEEMLDENGDPITATEQEQIYLNEALEESLRDADILEEIVLGKDDAEPERHEDRPDAFDYEHFILHSALGSYTRNKDGSNRESFASSGSAETARMYSSPVEGAVEDESGESTPRLKAQGSRPSLHFHARNNSGDSVSTVATFATANEGDDLEDEDSAPDDILNWTGNHSRPQDVGLQRVRNGELPTPPALSPREKIRHPEHIPLDSIVRSLISFAGLSNLQHSAEFSPSRLEAVDKELLESLLQSLGAFCSDIAQKNASAEGASKYERKLRRRRIDAARMVLDGEVDIEPA